MYYGGFTYSEARNLPVNFRAFFVDRINKEINRQNGVSDKENQPLSNEEKMIMRSKLAQVSPEQQKINNAITESRAPHHNRPDIRALQGKERTNVPTRLLRFNGP